MNDISVFSPVSETDPDFERFVSTVEQLFEKSMDSDLLDDRFNQQWRSEIVSHSSYRAILCREADQPIALLEHWATDAGNVRLELLLDRRFTEHDLTMPSSSSAADSVALLETLFATLVKETASSTPLFGPGRPPVELWARPTSRLVEQIVTKSGAKLSRHLFQMRTMPEPVGPDFVDQSIAFTNAYRDGLIEVNNLAFASHPDQGNMTPERFERLASEPWFVPEGIRLYQIEGNVAAFCWTKIHTSPSIGEIFVVGVHPKYQGKGLGKLVTTAGIHWLQNRQHQLVMLYVEASNVPAIAVYKRLGFRIVRTDKAWQLRLPVEPYGIDPLSESQK